VNWCLIMLNPFRSPGGGPHAARTRRDRLAAAPAKAGVLRAQLQERAFPLGRRP
jgi:hypothetical protein